MACPIQGSVFRLEELPKAEEERALAHKARTCRLVLADPAIPKAWKKEVMRSVIRLIDAYALQRAFAKYQTPPYINYQQFSPPSAHQYRKL
ncbi:MAG TPA: hypothetical protein VLE89_04760 [Chlamydiales bacterium]|nr:hypothetical protein [Chlamydiales bacterium]